MEQYPCYFDIYSTDLFIIQGFWFFPFSATAEPFLTFRGTFPSKKNTRETLLGVWDSISKFEVSISSLRRAVVEFSPVTN